jgi:hypothetical protein
VDATEADLREGIVRLGASRDREQAVTYALDHFSSVRLSVFDVSGRLIRSLKPTGNGPGVHTVTWDSSLLPSGVYLYRFETDRTVETRKLVLFR